jgi:hypothetical protein
MNIITPKNVTVWDNNFLQFTFFTSKPLLPMPFLGGFIIELRKNYI